MQHTSQPTLFINVFNFDGKDMPLESNGVAKTRAEAVRDAEDFADQYSYTLTDAGRLDLSSEFSEGFQSKRDFDAAVDAQIAARKEVV